MEIKLKGREMPRDTKGDVRFILLNGDPKPGCACATDILVDTQSVLAVFTPEEVVELVNRALYQLEYQRESHRKRGQAERDRHKALKAALKAAGKDVKVEEVNKQLKGE